MISSKTYTKQQQENVELKSKLENAKKTEAKRKLKTKMKLKLKKDKIMRTLFSRARSSLLISWMTN